MELIWATRFCEEYEWIHADYVQGNINRNALCCTYQNETFRVPYPILQPEYYAMGAIFPIMMSNYYNEEKKEVKDCPNMVVGSKQHPNIEVADDVGFSLIDKIQAIVGHEQLTINTPQVQTPSKFIYEKQDTGFSVRTEFHPIDKIQEVLRNEALQVKNDQIKGNPPTHQENYIKCGSKKCPTVRLSRTEESLMCEIRNRCRHKKNLFEHYNIISKLGNGSHGNVWLASNKLTNEMVAVKEITLAPEKLGMILMEIETLREYRHKNLVSFKECYATDDFLYLVMEYLDAGSLSKVITNTTMLEHDIANFCKEILEGIQFLHQRDIIHRDIKSDNIVLSMDGRIKITDFGFCTVVEDGEKCNDMLGTPHWMAPEVYEERPYDKKADIWSFGITVIEMIDKQVPYVEDHPDVAHRRIMELGIVDIRSWETLSYEFQDFLCRCLEIEPEERATAEELLQHPFLTGTVF